MVRASFAHRGIQGVSTPGGNKTGTIRYGLVAQYQRDPLTLYEFDTEIGAIITHRQYSTLGFSVDASPTVTATAYLPFASNWGNEGIVEGNVVNDDLNSFAADQTGIGDFAGDVTWRFAQVRRISFGLRGGLTLPTGQRNIYLGESSVRGLTGLLAMLDVGPLTVATDAGVTYRPVTDTETDFLHGPELNWNHGIRYGLPAIPVALTAQMMTRSGLTNCGKRPDPITGAPAGCVLFEPAETGAEAMGGFQVRPHRDVRLDLAAGRGLTLGAGTTDFRLLGAIQIQHVPRWPPPPPPPPPPVTVETVVIEEIPPEEPPEEPPWEEGELAKVVGEQIRIREKLQFIVNTPILLEESRPVLRALADVVNTNALIGHVVVEGHASEEGSFEFNYQLSESRARAIFEELIKAGVHPDRISYRGMGETQPIASGSHEEALAKNRRVEFHIVRQFAPEDNLPSYDKVIRLPWSGDKAEAITPKPPKPPEPEEPPDEFEDFAPEREDFEMEGGKAPEDQGKENK